MIVTSGILSVPPVALATVWEWMLPYVVKASNAAAARRLAIRIAELGRRDDAGTNPKVLGKMESLRKRFRELAAAAVEADGKTWNEAEADFRLSGLLDGWNHQPLLKRAPADGLDRAEEKYGKVKIMLRRVPEGDDGQAFMDSGDTKIRIDVSSYSPNAAVTKETLGHELLHWAQWYMSEALGVKFGLPGKAERTPDYKQDTFSDGSEDLVEDPVTGEPLKSNVAHSMDDIEFHPESDDMAADIVRRLGKARPEERRKALESMLGMGNYGHYLPDGFVTALRERSFPKWKRFVNEVLRKLSRSTISFSGLPSIRLQSGYEDGERSSGLSRPGDSAIDLGE